LTDNFDWSVAREDGWTIALEAARYGHLPHGFDRWDLADNSGQTVAYEAAERGHLPLDFDRWDLVPRYYHPRPSHFACRSDFNLA
jgi:hypothetical protein